MKRGEKRIENTAHVPVKKSSIPHFDCKNVIIEISSTPQPDIKIISIGKSSTPDNGSKSVGVATEVISSVREGFLAACRKEVNPAKKYRNDRAYIDAFAFTYIFEYSKALEFVNGYTEGSSNSSLTRSATSAQASVLPDTPEFNATSFPPGSSQQQSSFSCKNEDSNCSGCSLEAVKQTQSSLQSQLQARTLSEEIHKVSELQEGAVNGPYVYFWVIGNETGNFYSQC